MRTAEEVIRRDLRHNPQGVEETIESLCTSRAMTRDQLLQALVVVAYRTITTVNVDPAGLDAKLTAKDTGELTASCREQLGYLLGVNVELVERSPDDVSGTDQDLNGGPQS